MSFPFAVFGSMSFEVSEFFTGSYIINGLMVRVLIPLNLGQDCCALFLNE